MTNEEIDREMEDILLFHYLLYKGTREEVKDFLRHQRAHRVARKLHEEAKK